MPAEHQDLLIHSEVLWLSKGKFLERFVNLKDEITKFLKFSSNKIVTKWKLLLQHDDFMALNEQSQGKDKNIVDLDKLKPFQIQLRLFSSDLTSEKRVHFPKMHEIIHTSSVGVKIS
jgi:hypothetical protein